MTPARICAVVIERPGSPDVLEIRNVPTPTPHRGEVLMVEAFGLDRSELYTRLRPPPHVPFLRVDAT